MRYHVSPLLAILDHYRRESRTQREKGTYFEELIRTYFRHEPVYRDLYRDVWLYSDWAKEHGATYGLSAKLDTIVGSLSAVADKIDTLSQLSRTLGSDTEALSEQATRIIKLFDQLAAHRMIYSTHFHQCIFDHKPVSFEDKRLVLTDIQALESLNFIRHVDHNNSGDPIFIITRQGSSFAQQLPAIPI